MSDENKCFLLSCHAMKIEAEYTELSSEKESVGSEFYRIKTEAKDGAPPNYHISHMAGLAVAISSEEAKSLAKEVILRKWPEAEGWAIHSVQANEISDAQLEEALDHLRGGDSMMLLM